jgi:transcriptional regulator with XRE-family HTH domain
MRPDRIRYLRSSILRLTQPKFALMTGTSVATVSRWEKGKAQPTALSLVVLDAIQQAVDNYGDQRIRGVDWSLLFEQSGLLKVLAGIFNFATTSPLVTEPDTY